MRLLNVEEKYFLTWLFVYKIIFETMKKYANYWHWFQYLKLYKDVQRIVTSHMNAFCT